MMSDRHRQRGAVLPLLAIGLLAIIGVVGLSVDVGHAFLNKTRLQNSLDSAALSGARTLLLSDDPAAASVDARNAFGEHLGGEMAGLDTGDLILQYSDTLNPFVAGGSRPRFVRAAVESFATDVFFSAVLQGGGGSMDIAATAVAGPVPVGYPGAVETCDVAPLLICDRDPDDSDCSDGVCFGYEVGSGKVYQLMVGAGAEGLLPGEETPAAPSSPCGADGPFPIPDCERENVRVHRPECAGEDCMRESLAGGFDVCLSGSDPVRVADTVTQESVTQDLISRLDTTGISLAPSDYPPDVATTVHTEGSPYEYDRYRHDVASIVSSGSVSDGALHRRVLTVPVVSCGDDAGGALTAPLSGFLCLFLSSVIEEGEPGGGIYGQFVDGCEASGEQGASVPPMSGVNDGPVEIVLYKDPDSDDS